MHTYFKSLFFLGTLLFPQIAFAHSPIKGIGHFFNGVLHPVFAPEQILIILGFGLWFGQHKPNQYKHIIFLFLAATILGLLASEYLHFSNKSLLLLILTTFIGALIITRRHYFQSLFIIISILGGFVLGLDSAQDDLTGKTKLLSLFGSGVGIYFLMLYSMAFSESFSVKPWKVIAVRILASWLTASAIMVLALSFAN